MKKINKIVSMCIMWSILFSTIFGFIKPITCYAYTVEPKVEAGGYHSLALMPDGTVKAWGDNSVGQLGNRYTMDHLSPVPITGLTNVKQLSAGAYHSLALMNDGTVKAWGWNVTGQLGVGSTVNQNSPVTIPGLVNVKQVSAGDYYSFALMNDGTIKSWGRNDYGQLGIGSTTNHNSPVTVPELANVIQIVARNNHCLALLNDGTVKAWGQNNFGQLGIGSTIDQTSPVIVSGLANVKQLAIGMYHSLALLNDETVKAWGFNHYGQLGIGSKIAQISPVTVHGLTNVKQLAAGYYHSAAVMNDGTVNVWGFNDYGELGIGTNISKISPVTVSGLTNIAYLSLGDYYSLALMSDGTVKSWGYNIHGGLGIGSTTIKVFSPVIVPGLILFTDTVAPVITIGSYNKEVINQDILVTATTNEGTLNTNSHTFTENGSFIFTATDAVGNISSETVTITNIDKVAPVINVVLQDPDTLTASKIINVTVSDVNSFTVELPDKSIKTNETNFTYEITENGTYIFTTTDLAGNSSTATVSTNSIETGINEVTEVVYNAEANNTEATINVTAQSESGIVSISINGIVTEGLTASYLVKANGVYTAVITNGNGTVLNKYIEVTGIAEIINDLYITTDIDDSYIADGYVVITATVTGAFDTLSYGNETTTENTIRILARVDGTYTFKANRGTASVSADVVIDTLTYQLQNVPKISIEQEYVSTGVLASVTIKPIENTTIKTIKVYESETLIAKNSYKNSIEFSTTSFGDYYIVVTDSLNTETTKSLLVKEGSVQYDVGYEVVGPKAVITVNATAYGTANVASIEILGGGVLKVVTGESSAALEVSKNGLYRITVKDDIGGTETKYLEITEINDSFYITATIDDSKVLEGTASITATVFGEFDSFSFGEQTILENTTTVDVTKDGVYTFTVTFGDVTISKNVKVDVFASLATKTEINIDIAEGGLVTITATPATDAFIKTIEVYKDGNLVIRNVYRRVLKFTTNDYGNFEVLVTTLNNEKTTKTFVIEFDPVNVEAVYTVAGPKATIEVNATTSSDATIATIELAGQTVSNQQTATFEVTENGVYQINVTDNKGYSKIKTITVEGITNITLIELSADESTVLDGYVSINAAVVGNYDTFTFEGNVITSSAITVKVTADGTYTFTATKGLETINSEITITAFASIPKNSGVEVLVTKNIDGSYLINATATPVLGTTIKSIKIYKDGLLIVKNSYKTTLSKIVTDAGNYKVEVINNLNEITTKEFIIE